MREQDDKASSFPSRQGKPILREMAAFAIPRRFLSASCESLGFFWGFRERNHLRAIHLPHGIGDLRCVLFSGEAIKKVSEQK